MSGPIVIYSQSSWGLSEWQRYFQLVLTPSKVEPHGCALLIKDAAGRIGFCTRDLGEVGPEQFEAEARLTFQNLLDLKEKLYGERLPAGSAGHVP